MDDYNCSEAGDGCRTVVTCDSRGISSDLIVASNPSGSGGIALNCNFEELHFRQPKCNYEGGGAPPNRFDRPDAYCVGSRWTDNEKSTTRIRMWICVDTAVGYYPTWVPWLRSEDVSDWDHSSPPAAQAQVLVVDYNFGADGEYRRISELDENAPLILVPKGTDINSAIIHGRYGAAYGGSDRGAKAVDLQNTRANDGQVASGARSFIAAGENNKASGQHSHAQPLCAAEQKVPVGAIRPSYIESEFLFEK